MGSSCATQRAPATVSDPASLSLNQLGNYKILSSLSISKLSNYKIFSAQQKRKRTSAALRQKPKSYKAGKRKMKPKPKLPSQADLPPLNSSAWVTTDYTAPEGESGTLMHAQIDAQPGQQPWRVIRYPARGECVWWQECPCGMGVSYASLDACHIGARPLNQPPIATMRQHKAVEAGVCSGVLDAESKAVDPAALIAAIHVAVRDHKPDKKVAFTKHAHSLK